MTLEHSRYHIVPRSYATQLKFLLTCRLLKGWHALQLIWLGPTAAEDEVIAMPGIVAVQDCWVLHIMAGPDLHRSHPLDVR